MGNGITMGFIENCTHYPQILYGHSFCGCGYGFGCADPWYASCGTLLIQLCYGAKGCGHASKHEWYHI